MLSNQFLIGFLLNVVVKAKWRLIVAIYMAHFFTSWLLLLVCNEPVAKNVVDFIYYYSTTISTIGYGDISPQTNGGKLIFSFFVAPIGLPLYGLLIAKFSEFYVMARQKILSGKISAHGEKGHIIVVGWVPSRTPRLINLLEESGKSIVLVSEQSGLEHPFPDTDIKYVNITSFLDKKELDRLGLQSCDSVVINAGSDEKNHFACVSLSQKLDQVSSDAHVVVYAEDSNVQGILEACGDRIEVINVHQEHMLARSALYAGSSSCSEALLNPNISATQFTVQLPDLTKPISFGEVSDLFRKQFGVILIGYSNSKDKLGRNLHLAPDDKTIILGGEYIHYVGFNHVEVSKEMFK